METVAAHNLQMPVTYDESGVLWSRFDVFGTPEYVLLNQQGEVLHRSIGHDDKLEPALDAALESSGVDAQKSLKMSRPDTGHHMVRDTDGNTIEIMPTGSETIVAYHFAPWCASYVEESYPELSEKCRAFNEQLIALGKKHSSNVKLIGFVVAYSSNEDGVRSFKSRKNIAHPLVFDTTHAYAALAGTRNFPHVTVIAPSGEIVYSGNTVPSNINQLSQVSLSH